MTRSDWFKCGLRFECLPDCGACCVRHDDFSMVYLSSEDAVRLAGHLEVPLESFLEQYAVLEDGELALRLDAAHCTFLEGTRCSVYPARPLQCRSFPFWPRFLQSPESWNELRRFCPGIDQGPRHDADGIHEVSDCFQRSGLGD